MWFKEKGQAHCQLRDELELKVQELDLCNCMFCVVFYWNSIYKYVIICGQSSASGRKRGTTKMSNNKRMSK